MLKHYECVRQDGEKDCGIASLETIIHTYHGEVSKEYLRTLTHTSKNGVSAFYLLEAGKRLGFQTQGMKGNFLDIKEDMLPCIAHITVNQSYEHFVVIHEIKREKEYLIVADPALGIRTISFKEWERIATGYYLFFLPEAPMVYQRKEKSLFFSFIGSLLSYHKILLFIFLLSLLFVVFQVISSLSFQVLLEQMGSKRNSIFFLIVFMSIVLLREIDNYLRIELTSWLESRMNKTLFQTVYQAILSLPYPYFKNRTTGEVMSRIQDVEGLENGAISLFFSLLLNVFLTFFLFLVLFSISVPITMLVLIIFLLLLGASFFFRFLFLDKVVLYQQENNRFFSNLNESIMGIETLKNLQMESSNFSKVGTLHKNKEIKKRNATKCLAHFSTITKIVIGLTHSLVLYFGIQEVAIQTIPLERFFTYYFLVGYLTSSLGEICHFIYQYQGVKESFKRLDEIINYPREKLELDEKYKEGDKISTIEIKDLSYQYSSKLQILKHFNCKVGNHEKILIYGDSGCGKSTLGKLISGYLELNPSILLDDRKQCDVSLLTLRNHIGYMNQNEMLFTGSIYDNIVLGQKVSYEEFLQVAEISQVSFIHDRSRLGYQFLLEENGFNVSGGERQRILLARMLLRNYDVYILDEAFSQIDVKTEREILTALFRRYPDKIFLVISHRLSNQDLYDKKIHMRKEYI